MTLGNPFVWYPAVVNFGIFGPLSALSGVWGIPYLMQIYHLDKATAASIVMTIILGNLLGNLLVGYFSDRVFGKRRLPMLLMFPVNTGIWLLLSFWTGEKLPLILIPGFFGLLGFTAAAGSLTWACAKEISPPAISGVAMGTVNIGGFVGTALMQPLFGYVLDLNWSGKMVEGVRIYSAGAYRLGFLICSLVALLGLVSAIFVKETNCKHLYE